jgi:D-3-phosphoglycerate dehydrogenase
MNNILTLNAISEKANVAFNENYAIGSDVANPVGIMLRSFNMHEYELPADVIARCAATGAPGEGPDMEAIIAEMQAVYDAYYARAAAKSE